MAITWKPIARRTDAYTSWKASVGLLDIIIDHYPVAWRKTEPGFYVRVSGNFAHTKVKPYTTMEEAQQAGYKLLRKEMQQILKQLDSV